ncbi:MAG: UvrD-helicase domain-containing protein [Candidatus Kerfeldbacteria bacterium]|nr:UvrD-helicase domain-containing protein [Candidatus Kerfeldbacteria bacterium]
MEGLGQLNQAQRRAVTHGDGPLLIVAGAGTGKTTVITQRVAWLVVEQGLKTDNVLALTFTDKAAGEMADRVSALLPYGYLDLWVSTFHSFCERILKEHGLEIGLNTDFALFNETGQWRLIRRHLERFSLDVYRPRGNPTKFIRALVKHFSRAKDEAVTPEQYVEYARSLQLDRDSDAFVKKAAADDQVSEVRRIQEVANAYHVYQQLLHEQNALDFGDLLLETLRLFRERADVLGRYREQFQSILVDEFQDTNWAQYELIKLLAAPRNNLTVVGDDDQSIYKFRGASVSNILEFKKDFPNSAEVVLTDNYRTKQNILDFAYRFIQLNNPERLEYKLGTGRKPQGMGRRARGAGGSFRTAVSKKLTAERKGNGTIELLHAGTQDDEADLIADTILRLKDSAGRTPSSWSDFAVLVRANDHALPVLESFKRKRIPHQFVASRGLFRKPEVLDVMAYLKLLDDYHESQALYRVAQLPTFNIATGDLIELGHAAKRESHSLYDTFRRVATLKQVSNEGRQGVEKLMRLIQRHTDAARRTSVMEVIMAFLEDSGLLADYENPQNARDYERTKTLLQFLTLVQDFQRGNDEPTVKRFLEDLEGQIEAGEQGRLAIDLDDTPDAVRVLTIHAAKGLEFPFVFVPQLVDKRFPTIERPDPIALPNALVNEILPEGDVHLQEERRLFYVAATRCRDGLYLSWALDYGGVTNKKPSAFLYETGLLEKPVKKPAAARTLPKTTAEKPAPPLEPALQRVVDEDDSFNYYKLHSYELCPWRYRYEHVLKVPGKLTGNLSFGSTMHNTLFEFFKLLKQRAEAEQGSFFGPGDASPKRKLRTDTDLVSEKELLDLYDRLWIGEWYESEQQMEERRAEGREALKRFYAAHRGDWPIPWKLEQRFTVKHGQITLLGKIDRIDITDESGDKPRVAIIDYKTTRSTATKKLFKQSERYQLFLYTLALQDPQLFDVQVEKLQFSFVLDGTTEEYEPKRPDLESVTTWADGIIAKIKAGQFAATPGMVCRSCDFRNICPYRAE